MNLTNLTTLPSLDGQHLLWRKLFGSSASLVLAELAKKQTVIYVCAQSKNQTVIEKEISFYSNASHSKDSVNILNFPDWECLPYDRISPHPDIISNRLLTLHKLPSLQQGLVITPITALIQRLAPTNYIDANTFDLKINDEINLEQFKRRLIDAGYYSVNQVMSAGEFAIRGGIIDVFPSGTDNPFRLDLFDTTIESIKLFDTETQRSNESLNQIKLLPAREYPLQDESIQRFRQAFRQTFDGDPRKAYIYNQITNGLAPTGSEFYLPLFFEETSSLFDFVGENCVFVFEEGAIESIETLSTETKERYENAQLNPEWPPLKPNKLFLSQSEVYENLKSHKRIDLANLNLKASKHLIEYNTQPPAKFTINPRNEQPYQALFDYFDVSTNKILIAAESAGRRESIHSLLKDNNRSCQVVDSWQDFIASDSKLCLTVAEIERGLLLNEDKLEIITEAQLYGERTKQHRRRSDKNRDPDAIIKSLAELNLGDPVVHEDHGVGRYRGLDTLTLNGGDDEFMIIEYFEGDKVYIPVLTLDRVSRYVGGNPDTAPLHKMGSDTWVKLRTKAKEKAYDVAAELLEIQALRLARKGHAFPDVDDSYDAFASGFEFQETPDQEQVINDVISDMVSERPMDRLVCGDVGFGKTEIALRAAYMAIAGNKQVVMLVPTTLLAQQHYNNFADRFADWPVRIELFSRFRTAKETQAALEGIANGQVDIAIGTHKLLQKDVGFKNLGLMMIDEEHRFGVRQKERLKQLRSQVDILTLTATPIPRTLNFALSGLRDISIIATPPRARLSVQTFVREWDDALIREALIREIRRGGQVYFLHNEVRTIEKIEAQLQALVPEAQIKHAHGQMRERELESIMRDFYHQRFNVLLCTTIIESGIDIPTANTIIINKADRFGLAQLHQLRGRVGRSHHQAYAYMLAPELKSLTADARKRLTAIEALDTLGAGFALASQDLEIRGAGELLGESQSGTIDQIGYSMYSTFLDQAINSIKHKRQQKNGEIIKGTPLNAAQRLEDVDVNLHIPARFPDAYLPDVHLRLTMYKRISSAQNNEQLHELKIETIDRFGLLPEAANNLFDIAEIKLLAWHNQIKSIEVGAKGGRFKFIENADINLDRLIPIMSSKPKEFGFDGADVLHIKRNLDEPTTRKALVKEVVQLIAHDH